MAAPSAPPSYSPGFPDPSSNKLDSQQPQPVSDQPPQPVSGQPPPYSNVYPPAGQAMMPQPQSTQPMAGQTTMMPQAQGAQWAAGVGGMAAHQHQYRVGGQNAQEYSQQAQDEESGQNWDNNLTGFSEKAIRLAFIKKVFAILAVMLVVTGGVMCIFMFVDDIKDYASDHIWVYLTAICVYIVAVIALVCAGDLRRKVPLNLIFLGIITIAMGTMLGCIATTYDAEEVLMAVGITLIITLGMMALGFQNKFDFTAGVGVMCVLTFGLLGFGLMCAIFRSEILYIFYACLGAALFSLWIVIDIQMMLGGKHKFSISPEEYIVAALNLYLDIINILLYVLMIIGMVKN